MRSGNDKGSFPSKHYATTEDKALMKTGTINPMELYQNKILSAKAGLYVIDGTVS
jgi:hypothetical protein